MRLNLLLAAKCDMVSHVKFACPCKEDVWSHECCHVADAAFFWALIYIYIYIYIYKC